jgi:predicted ATPase
MSRIVLKELRLRNYKAFADARLVLDDVTFLVGRNGAGKSTLMDAFSFIREAVTDSLATALERRGNLAGIRQQRHRSANRVCVSVCFEVRNSQPINRFLYGFCIDVNSESDGYEVKLEALLSNRRAGDPPIVTEFARSQNFFRCDSANIHPEVPPEALLLPVIAGADEKRTHHVQWRDILETLSRVSSHQLSPEAIRNEPRIGSEGRLIGDGRNAGDVLKHVNETDRDWIIKHLAAAVPGVTNVCSSSRAGRRVIVFTQEQADDYEFLGNTNDFDAAMMSDGTLRAFGTFLALRQTPRPSIVLLDEIEDSLHPYAHGVLLDAIEAASVDFPVVVSTHSPEILDHPSANGERIRVVQWDKGTSHIYTLSDKVLAKLKPPMTVGMLLRSNALWTVEEPSVNGSEDDFFKVS